MATGLTGAEPTAIQYYSSHFNLLTYQVAQADPHLHTWTWKSLPMEKVVTDTQPGQLQYILLSTWAVLSAQIVASGKLLREFIIENPFFHAVCLGG